jgi:hypothetical protein
MNDDKKTKFAVKLEEAKGLIKEKKLEEALLLLERMKGYNDDIFDDSMVHEFYMLHSNVQSTVRGKLIYEKLLPISESKEKISYQEAFGILGEALIGLNEEIIRRELEILILKGIAPWSSNDEYIIFSK